MMPTTATAIPLPPELLRVRAEVAALSADTGHAAATSVICAS
jgi:hypothetical protein